MTYPAPIKVCNKLSAYVKGIETEPEELQSAQVCMCEQSYALKIAGVSRNALIASHQVGTASLKKM